MVPVLQRQSTKMPASKMRWMSLLALLLLVLVMLIASVEKIHELTSAGAAGGDWPTYLHDLQRTGAGSDTILSPANVGQLTKSWSFKTGGVIASSPTVVGGTVYVGSWDGYEYALDAATGAMKWKTYLGVTQVPTCDPPSLGISSAAAVQNGVVYVGGGDSYWYALDATSGAILWKVFTGDNSGASGHYNWSSPLIYNGYAYIGVASLGDCPLVQGQLLQVSLSTHQVVNTFNAVPAGQTGGGIWVSPSIDTTTNTIYVATGTQSTPFQPYSQAVVSLNASTLAVKDSWKLPESEVANNSDFSGTPILFNDAAGNPLVAALNNDGSVFAFNRTNLAGGPIWQDQIVSDGTNAGTVSSGAFANGRLYEAGGNTSINGVGYKGAVRALDPATGKYLWQHGAPDVVVPALAYSNGLVIDGAGSVLEVLDATTGTRLYSYTTSNRMYAAPSVSNGQIFTGNNDGYVYAFGLPTTPPPTPTPDPNCPSGWSCQDIGNPAPAGSETVSGGTWTVNAGGAGIGGTSDQFRFITQNASGDTQISAQVVSQQTTSGSAQAGLMVRQSSDPTSPYYAAFLTKNNGLVVQYRLAFGGTTATAAQMATASPPLYLEIQRVGDQFQAATSNDGVTYTLVPGSTANVPMPAALLDGLAISSGTQGTLDTVAYSAATVGSPNTPPNPQPPATPCPNGWSCADIGNPSVVGDQSLSGGTWTLKGTGIDIAGYSDQFHYVWQSLAADGTISAHVLSQTNTGDWARAGIMMRQSTNAGSAYYGAFVTPANGIVVQYRPTQGLDTKILTQNTGTVPAYLEIARSGNNFSAYTSSDGVNWKYVISSTIALSLSGSILVGLAVSAHSGGAVSTATFDTVNISNTAPPPPTGCPSGWTCADIGGYQPAGSQSFSGGIWGVQAAGYDIWDIGDQFRYLWQSLAADGTISAHILSQQNTEGWAKAGVMLRQTTDPGSPYYGVFMTPSNGITVQYRAAQGNATVQLTLFAGTSPAYFMVGRTGNTYSTYTSSDGITWTIVGGSTVTLNMNGPILAGLAVTSHDVGILGTTTFDTVSISTTLPPPPGCPSNWSCVDIGNPALAGTQSVNGGTWTIQGAGNDIWGTSDQFHFVSQSLAADGSASAHVLSQTNTNGWAKAGVMLRQSTDPGSAYYFASVTPSNGINVQYRPTQGAGSLQLSVLTGTVPTYLKVTRSGNIYTTYTSSDGNTWTPVAGSSITLNLSGSLLAGMAVTSHNATTLSTVTFDTVSVSAAQPGVCPSNWSCADIGYPALAGSQSLNGGTWTVQGAGGDIWGTADQFHFVSQSLAADGSVSAHVLSQTNTDGWAKAGVMLRQSTDPGSAYYFAFVTPSNGINVQYRPTQGAGSLQLSVLTGTVPTYLMVARSGNIYTTYTSSDGNTWTPVAGSSITLNLSGSLLAGMAVTSHNVGALNTVTFDTVSISTILLPPPGCPSNWSCADIGYPALAGSQSLNGGTWTVQGAGGDIWGAADQFHFVSQSLAADGSASAHVLSQTNTDGWAKAGVMLRQSTDPGSAYYFAFVTPSNGINVQYRSAQGAGSVQLIGLTGTVPTYLKVTRSGNIYTTYTSSDGNTWTPVAGSSITLNLSGPILAGMAVTSHNPTALCTVTFDTVSVG